MISDRSDMRADRAEGLGHVVPGSQSAPRAGVGGALLDALLRRLIRRGRLEVMWPDGGRRVYGPGAAGPAIRLEDAAAVRRLALNPELGFGEAYMDGGLTVEAGSLAEVLAVLAENAASWRERTPPALRRLRRLWNAARVNRRGRARRNVAHHYDLDGRLYRMFLDADMQYSCAYFETGTETLEAAQAAKKRLIAAKLKLDRPGLRVLDIGSGWGGLALTLARDYGAEVLGITLSEEQLAAARARAAAEGLEGRVRFELRDFRDANGVFDRVVSVGMFEHVGAAQYGTFFAAVAGRLAQDGVALLHTIGNSGPPARTNAWLEKYIFPGGYAPALSEVLPPLERAGLIATDIEVLRGHYALTLAAWRHRFAARRADIAALYDERFCRMFEFYLAGAEMAFRYDNEVVFQVQMVRDANVLPLTRGYMTAQGGCGDEKEGKGLCPLDPIEGGAFEIRGGV